jgi:hypothetical protein
LRGRQLNSTVVTRAIGIGAAALAVLVVAAYFASPFFALGSLSRAVRAGDRDKLSVLVDFPAVRTSLKDQFSALVAQRANDREEFKKNPFAQLVLMLVPVILDKVVDAIVTPDGIAELLARPIGNRPERDGEKKKRWNRSWSFVDFDHFRAQYTDPDDPRIVFGLVFERRGLLSWKLARLDLPSDELTKRFEGAHGSEGESAQGQENASPDNSESTALPERVGACAVISVRRVTTRLEDADGTEVAGSGSAIEYANGGYQVSYDTIDGIEHSRTGDRVQLCLTEIPQHCPPGDNRGRVYHALNLRTREEWSAPDAEHSCGGA